MFILCENNGGDGSYNIIMISNSGAQLRPESTPHLSNLKIYTKSNNTPIQKTSGMKTHRMPNSKQVEISHYLTCLQQSSLTSF